MHASSLQCIQPYGKPKNKMYKKITLIPTLILLSIILTSWGYNGHNLISGNMTVNLPEEMAEFRAWNTYITEHASDPDYRKGDDPTEGPKHYIDVDNYSEFIASGSIPQDLDQVILEHGASFVDNNGYLPWATINTYDSLVVSFQNRDWDKAKYFAADLGHYVGDGFMPLHITRNYDGQYTDNKGIHGRYESDMINRIKDQIQISKTEIVNIEVVEDYIFNYLYDSYEYVDSILEADNYGKSINSDTHSTEYLDAMWEYSENFTQDIFNAATVAFSSLFYAAWVEAGKPLISTTLVKSMDKPNQSDLICFPNPTNNYTTVKFNADLNQGYELSLLNSGGSVMKKIIDSNPSEEVVELNWNLSTYEAGMYVLLLQTQEEKISRKIMLSN